MHKGNRVRNVIRGASLFTCALALNSCTEKHILLYTIQDWIPFQEQLMTDELHITLLIKPARIMLLLVATRPLRFKNIKEEMRKNKSEFRISLILHPLQSWRQGDSHKVSAFSTACIPTKGHNTTFKTFRSWFLENYGKRNTQYFSYKDFIISDQ